MMKPNYSFILSLTVGHLLFLQNSTEAQTMLSSVPADAVLKASGVKTGTDLALSQAQSPDHTTRLQLLKASGLTKQAQLFETRWLG